MIRLISIVTLFSCFAFAQQPNTVTATVSGVQPATGGTAVFRIQFLSAALTSTVETAVSAVGSLGLSASNLTSVSVALSQGVVASQYDFTLRTPAPEFVAKRDAVIALQRAQTSASTAVGWSVSYEVEEAEMARVRKEALAGLLERARADAESLASAMGRGLGALTAIATPAVFRNGLEVTVTLTASYAVQPPQS